jgi:hypothetical protein
MKEGGLEEEAKGNNEPISVRDKQIEQVSAPMNPLFKIMSSIQDIMSDSIHL